MLSGLNPVAQNDSVLALRSMFEARKRVFVDLLKWQVPVHEGRFELDQYDTIRAEYLILSDEAGNHRASGRLLRTDGPHILADLFGELCEDTVPTGPTCREITRFCIDPAQTSPERRVARNQLVTVLVDHALECGITDYTGVAAPGWFEQIARFGWNCRALGEVREIGGHRLVALHIRIDTKTRAALTGSGIYSPISRGVVTAGGVQ